MAVSFKFLTNGFNRKSWNKTRTVLYSFCRAYMLTSLFCESFYMIEFEQEYLRIVNWSCVFSLLLRNDEQKIIVMCGKQCRYNKATCKRFLGQTRITFNHKKSWCDQNCVCTGKWFVILFFSLCFCFLQLDFQLFPLNFVNSL